MENRRTLTNGQHVWVQDEGTVKPGLLLWWEKRGDTWWGRTAVVDADGEPALVDYAAARLRPTHTDTPAAQTDRSD